MDENLLIVSGCLWDDMNATRVSRPLARGRKVDKEGFLQDIEGAYHAIGGFARLAHLANEDPRWFFNRFGDRLLPNIKEELDVNVHIHPPLPPSPLDEVIDVTPIALDRDRDRAPGSPPQGAPCSTGPEHTGEEDGEGGAFT